MIRKRMTIALCVLLALGPMVAFGGGTKEPAPKGPTTLTVWDFKYGDPRTGAVMKKIDNAFMAANPGIVINHVAQPEDNYYQLLGTAAAAKKGPDIALFHVGAKHQDFDEYLTDLSTLSASVKGNFTEGSVAKSSDKAGKKWEIYPMTMQGMGIYYNKALFRKAGLDPEKAPKSAAEFLAACAALKAANIVPIMGGQTFTVDFLFRCLTASAFGPKVPQLGTSAASFTDPAFVASAKFVQTLVSEGYIDPKSKDRPYFMEGIDAFAAGKGAIFVGLLSDIAHWKQFGDALGKTEVGYFPTVNLSEAKYPDYQASQAAGIGYGIFTWSPAQAAAAKYLEYCSAGAGSETFSAELGALSPNKKIDAVKLGYSALTEINKYLGKATEDYLNMAKFEGGLESQVQRLQDQAYILGTLSPANYAEMMDKTLASMRLK